MAYIRRKLILTGGRAGATVVLSKHQFVDGVTVVEGDDTNLEGLCRYMGRVFKAFPEGSVELAHYQELDHKEKENGQCHAQTDTRHGSAAVPPGVSSGQSGIASVPSAVSPGTAGTHDGESSAISEGNRLPDSGDDSNVAGKTCLLEALNKLDPYKDEHWTVDGRPRIDAVVEISGVPTVTRAQLDTVAPGFVRPE